MTRSVKGFSARGIYVLWGHHFSTLRIPAQRSDELVIHGLLNTFEILQRQLTTTPHPEVRKKTEPQAAFIAAHLDFLLKRTTTEADAAEEPPVSEPRSMLLRSHTIPSPRKPAKRGTQ